jgi:Holliday junction resolvase RusA-like endonuclease
VIAFSVWIPGVPKGQPRPRAFSRGGKARVYDPGTAEGWKSAIAREVGPHLPEKPLGGPVAVSLHLSMPRPKAHYKRGVLRLEAPAWHTSRPDADNVLKAVLDALTTVGLWHDDAQVCRVTVDRKYGERPGALLEVREVGG